MSHLRIYLFPEKGEPIIQKEFSNAHGFAMRIWRSLRRRYNIRPDNWILNKIVPMEEWLEYLWPLYPIWLKHQKPLYECEIISLASTFDLATVHRKDFGRLAEAWLEFSELHHDWGKTAVDHLPAMAKFLLDANWIKEDLRVHTMGIYGHSVGRNLFRTDGDSKYLTVDNNDGKFWYFMDEIIPKLK